MSLSKRTITIVATPALLIFTVVVWRSMRQPAQPQVDVSSVVVLPAKVSAAPELAYLTDALPGTLSTLLGQVPLLQTKRPPNSLDLERFHGNLQRVAELYGVQSFIVPAITADADALILDVAIVDAPTRTQLWTRQFKGRRDGYNEMMRTAADSLGRALRPNQVSLGMTTRGLAANSSAEFAYREGQYFFNRYRAEHAEPDFTKALQAFQRAVDADPALANAAAYIGWLHLHANTPDEIKRWTDRAMQIDPRCGLALALRVQLMQQQQFDSMKALPLSLQAATFSPNEPFVIETLATALDASVALQNAAYVEAARLDPLSTGPVLEIALNTRKLGQPEDGIRFLDQVIQVEPTLTAAIAGKILLLLELNRLDAVDEMLKSAPDQTGYPWLTAKRMVAIARHDVATEKASQEELAKLRHDSSVDLNTVPLLIKFGRIDQAYDIMNAAIKLGHVPAYDWLMTDPAFSKIRDQKRFKPILDRSHEAFKEMMAVLDQAKARGELPFFFERPLGELRTQY